MPGRSSPPTDAAAPATGGDGPSPLARVAAALLAVVGVQVSLLAGGGAWPPNRRVLGALAAGAAVAAVLAAWPRARDAVSATLRRAAGAPRRSRAVAAAGVFVVAGVYLYSTAAYQGRSLTPKYQDEFSYLLQARMLAEGRLWMPPHPLGEAFQSFQVLTSPVYASIYFPGAAAMYAPGVWAGTSAWLIPLILSAACVALLFLIVGELLDPVYGLAAAAMLLGLTIFRLQSVMVMAQIPALLLGLGMTWAWLRWRTKAVHAGDGRGAWGWELMIGACAGWAAITRPVDALCFAMPVGVAMLAAAIRGRSPIAIRSIAIAAAAAMPFLAVQLAFNRGVTGSFVETPFGHYADRFFPGTRYGFGPSDPAARPATALPQFQKYYDAEIRPRLADHTPAAAAERWATRHLPTTLTHGLPHAVLIALLPGGLLAARRRPTALVPLATAALFPLLYWPYAFFLPHYTLVAMPGVVLLALLGVRALAGAAGRRFAPAVGAGLLVAVVGVSVVELPEFNRGNYDEFFPAAGIGEVDRALAEAIAPDERAVVLFRFPPDGNPHEEPAYNVSTAWPDDARVIRAHDLGDAANAALFRYYAQRDPDRQAWRYDRGSGRLSRLRRVSELAGAPIIPPTTTQPGRPEGNRP